MDIDDDFDADAGDPQWSPEARQRYLAAAETAIRTLREHTVLTLARQGRPAEQEGYFASAEMLARDLAALSDAEFDWAGSFPFALDEADADGGFEDLDDDEDPPGEPGEGSAEPGTAMTVEYRAQLEVLDVDALLAAGRAAYRRVWPEDSDEEAELTVADPATAVAQLIHADGMGSLRAADHLHELWGELSISSDQEPAPPDA